MHAPCAGVCGLCLYYILEACVLHMQKMGHVLFPLLLSLRTSKHSGHLIENRHKKILKCGERKAGQLQTWRPEEWHGGGQSPGFSFCLMYRTPAAPNTNGHRGKKEGEAPKKSLSSRVGEPRILPYQTVMRGPTAPQDGIHCAVDISAPTTAQW